MRRAETIGWAALAIALACCATPRPVRVRRPHAERLPPKPDVPLPAGPEPKIYVLVQARPALEVLLASPDRDHLHAEGVELLRTCDEMGDPRKVALFVRETRLVG